MEAVDPKVPLSLLPAGSRAIVANGPRNEYNDLPLIRTPRHRVITRWSPTPEERQAIARGEDIYVTMLAANSIPPFYVTAGPVDWSEERFES